MAFRCKDLSPRNSKQLVPPIISGYRNWRTFNSLNFFEKQIIWIALALPWIDLFTFGWFTHIKDGGLESYFGRMTSHDASIYFVVVVLMNIIGAKAAMTLAELAGLLRKGRVRMVTHGPFWVFMPER